MILCALAISFSASGQDGEAFMQVRPVRMLDALHAMLQSHPQIEIGAQQVELSNGELKVARGQFDLVWNANLQQSHLTSPLTTLERLQAFQGGIDMASQSADVTSLSAAATKNYRNGVSISPTFTDSRNTNNLLNQDALNQSQISFEVNVPLLKDAESRLRMRRRWRPSSTFARAFTR